MPVAPTPHYTWQQIVEIALHHRRELLLAHLIALTAAVISVPVPLLMPLLVDEVLLEKPGLMVQSIDSVFPGAWHGPVLYVLVVLWLTLTLRLATLALGVWQMRQFTGISKDVIYRMRRGLLRRLERVSMAEYETLGSGTVASHMVTDLDAIDQFVGTTISRLLVALLSIVGAAVVLLWMHWPLALFILFLNPVVIYFTSALGRRVKDLKRRENAAYQVFQESLVETLDAIQQIRASNRERQFITRVIDRARGVKDSSAAYSWKSEAASRLSFTVFLFGFDIFRAISMFMVVFSDLTIGQMLAVFAYLWFMMGPVQEVLGIQYAFHSAQAALGRINLLFDMDSEPRYPHRRNPFQGEPSVGICLDDINFRYGEGPLVLDRVSLSIQAGEKVALVGASGGGKTTLVRILLGLYPPQSGTVYFDGIPVTEIGLDVVRDHVATVLQHPALFNDTVRMNLTLGRDLPDQKLWEALKIAQLQETIESLERKLETPLGRQGIRLSGGERQRLAIARMVLSDAKVVILDEATSALDTATEAAVHASLDRFLEGRTTLIIAHRLSSVRRAHRVLVFDGGRIIEEGQHEDLIANNGVYAQLYGTQHPH